MAKAGNHSKQTVTHSTASSPNNDRPPVEPAQPALEDCCRSGCTPCVFDLYEEAMERYRAALAAWRVRQNPSNS